MPSDTTSGHKGHHYIVPEHQVQNTTLRYSETTCVQQPQSFIDIPSWRSEYVTVGAFPGTKVPRTPTTRMHQSKLWNCRFLTHLLTNGWWSQYSFSKSSSSTPKYLDMHLDVKFPKCIQWFKYPPLGLKDIKGHFGLQLHLKPSENSKH